MTLLWQHQRYFHFTHPRALYSLSDITGVHRNIHYPMTIVRISEERRCWELCNFPTPNNPHPRGSWDKSKNPYLLINHIKTQSATVRQLGTNCPVASWHSIETMMICITCIQNAACNIHSCTHGSRLLFVLILIKSQ